MNLRHRQWIVVTFTMSNVSTMYVTMYLAVIRYVR